MKLEVTEEEAWGIISGRWMTSHWRSVYLPAGISFVCFIVSALVLEGVLDLNDWISIPVSILLLIPGFFYYIKGLRKSGGEATLEIQALKDKLP